MEQMKARTVDAVRPARRLGSLPPYLFAEVDRRISEKRAAGFDVISLGIGDPDLPTPSHVVQAMAEAAADPANHRYPDYFGLLEFRKAVADWYKKRFAVTLDPETEVMSLIGSKEGIAHMAHAFLDPGDVALVPDPGYPVYAMGAILAGAQPYYMPLRLETGFLPDLEAVPKEVVARARLLWLNYPNNPTSAVASREFFKSALDFAARHGIPVCHDNAYSDVYFGDARPPSFLEIPGAMEMAVEFHSLSKTYNMTGWRIAMVVGNRRLLQSLGAVKTNVDSGVFQAVQKAAIAAFSTPRQWIEQRNAVYRRRRDLVLAALSRMGIQVPVPEASLYVWGPVPRGYKSLDFSLKVLDEVAVWITPGTGFGEAGEGYFRISLTIPDNRLEEAMERLRGLKW